MSEQKSKGHDEEPYRTDAYSLADIVAANERHDRAYGWSYLCATCYTNLLRFPESTTLPVGRAFERGNAETAISSGSSV